MRYAIGCMILGFLLGATLVNVANAEDLTELKADLTQFEADTSEWNSSDADLYDATVDFYISEVVKLLNQLHAVTDPETVEKIAAKIDTVSQELVTINVLIQKYRLIDKIDEAFQCIKR